ncbi:phosphoglycolate phosphatase [Marivivens aquimaris]|uniref:phosphoglycolate phosphatase n=1 Tax=Marivivens aquimaris TaxID=2774876 RepID=UPI00187EE41A|nr:phosphoglycolate phosphatase [Marivivens aquimaris]
MPERVRGTVIFDLDGTLVDSAPDLADALDTLLTERGLAPIGLEHTRSLIGHGIAELVRKGLEARGNYLAPEEQALATQQFVKHYTAHLSRKSQPYPGAAETLAALRHAGWRLVVCTNKREASARGLLEDLGLLQAFALVAGPDTFGVAKPDPKHLLSCLPESNPASKPAIMIGDSEVDVAAAKAAKLPIIAADWGYAKMPLAELRPDALVSSLSEVPDAVERLIG